MQIIDGKEANNLVDTNSVAGKVVQVLNIVLTEEEKKLLEERLNSTETDREWFGVAVELLFPNYIRAGST